jgi:hypothetical protein
VPSRTVTNGPFTLRRINGVATATRLVIVPTTARPPVAHTPFVTRTSSPGSAESTASWMTAAAVAQFVNGGVGFGLITST